MMQNIFKTRQQFENDIFGSADVGEDQAIEAKLRESVAGEIYKDYLLEVSRHHSIPVMDAEVLIFLEKIPHGGLVCDVGGCWGWHWRNIEKIRPDVKIVIVDFVKSNLLHARALLGNLIGKNVYLVHGDATNLEFKDSVFDGYWTVQTFQHIPNLASAIREAHRVLKPNGVFIDYVLNNSRALKLAYSLFGKKYVEDGFANGIFYLRRSSNVEEEILKEEFNSAVQFGFSEILFKPEVRFTISGRESSFLGNIDKRLTGNSLIGKFFGRQKSYFCFKNNASS